MDHDDRHGVFEFDVAAADNVTVGVVDALSTVRGVDPVEMEPLQSYVDVDALEGVVRSHFRQRCGGLTVSFRVDGYDVTVESYGRIHVEQCGDEHRTD